MKRWSLRQVFVLVLAVFVTTGMDLSAVQASAMVVKMAMPSDMGASGHHGCADCPDGGTKATICITACAAPVWALLPETAPVTAVPTTMVYPVFTPVLRGRASPPDPAPPRTTDIG